MGFLNSHAGGHRFDSCITHHPNFNKINGPIRGKSVFSRRELVKAVLATSGSVRRPGGTPFNDLVARLVERILFC
jgi:hypothetical protein